MTSTATDSKPRTADEMTAWLSGKLRQIQAGWPQHLVLDGSGADSQAASAHCSYSGHRKGVANSLPMRSPRSMASPRRSISAPSSARAI